MCFGGRKLLSAGKPQRTGRTRRCFASGSYTITGNIVIGRYVTRSSSGACGVKLRENETTRRHDAIAVNLPHIAVVQSPVRVLPWPDLPIQRDGGRSGNIDDRRESRRPAIAGVIRRAWHLLESWASI